MEPILSILQSKAECRTPIVVMREHTPSGSDASMVSIVQRIAARCDAFVEHIHAAKNDELTAIGKRIDTSIINGDWLLITFGKLFSTMDFLRFVGRRLFTIMPDPEKRPNMELFRLWLCLDETVVLPLVFKKVALPLDVRAISRQRTSGGDSEGEGDDNNALLDVSAIDADATPAAATERTASSAATRPPTAPTHISTRPSSCSMHSVPSTAEDMIDIPNDETACDFEQQFDTSSTSVSKAVIGATDSQLGPLFYRRLELSAGRRPTSSSGRAAEIRNLRIQSAKLRSSASVVKRQESSVAPASARATLGVNASGVVATPHRPHTANASAASVPTMPPRMHTTSDAQDAFDRMSSDVLQKLHGALIKSFVYSQEAAQRMLYTLLEYADSTVAGAGRGDSTSTPQSNVEMTSLIPSHNTDGLEIGDVLRTEEGITLRHGTWRSVEVLVEQMVPSEFASAWSTLARIRCRFKHPMVSSPLAVLQDANAQAIYVVYEFPSRGPLGSVLRRFGVEGKPVDVAARVAKCCAVGLQLLHNGGYVHRDVSAQQIFDLGEHKYQLRISNRCRQLEPDGACTAEGVVARWTSPDALFTGRFYPEDDVWSIGVLVWEVLSKCSSIPFSQHVTKEEVAAALANGDILDCPPEFQYHPVWTKIALPCFAVRMKRPTLTQIVAIADSILLR